MHFFVEYCYYKNEMRCFMKEFEHVLANFLITPTHTSIEQSKIRYGVEVIISEMQKLLIIYGVAIFLNCLLEAFVTHISFYILRQVCFGFHFENKATCIIWSIVLFPILSKISTYVRLDNLHLLIILGGSSLILLGIAPRGTAKHAVINDAHKQYLKKKIIKRIVILFIIALFIPPYFQKLITLGIIIELCLVILQIFKQPKELNTIEFS